MNIGKTINEFYYFSTEQEGRAQLPAGFVTKLVKDYQQKILPSVLSMLSEDFSKHFMERYFFCGFSVKQITIDPLNEKVIITLEQSISGRKLYKETVCLEFADVHPLNIFSDDADYPLPLTGAIVFGFIITFSSKNNRVKPSCKRPFRCNILLNNRLSIDLVFSSVRFTQANP